MERAFRETVVHTRQQHLSNNSFRQMIRRLFVTCIEKQPAPCRGLSGPPGPKCRKSLRNVCSGTPKSLQKVPEHSKNTLQTLSGDSPETCRTVPRLFLRLFGVSGPGAPGDIFESFWHFGPGGPGRPLLLVTFSWLFRGFSVACSWPSSVQKDSVCAFWRGAQP